MSEKEDSGVFLFIGGGVVLIGLSVMVLKAIQAFFDELTKSIRAFENTVVSFVPMLLHILEVVGLVSAIIAAAVGGVYFTYKYIRLVKRATELREYVECELNIRLLKIHTELSVNCASEAFALNTKMSHVQRKLEESLKPPTPISPSPLVVSTTPHIAATTNDAGNYENTTQGDETPDAECAPIPASQPY